MHDEPSDKPLRILHLEDSAVDHELVLRALRRAGLDPDKYEFINWTINCDVQIKEEV